MKTHRHNHFDKMPHLPVRKQRRRQLYHFNFLITTAFIWLVPWLFIGSSYGSSISQYRNQPANDDALTNAELRKYLTMYNQRTSTTTSSQVTPKPATTTLTTPMPMSAIMNRRRGSLAPAPTRNNTSNTDKVFPTSTQRSSFVPTEVMEHSSTQAPKENMADVVESLTLLNSLLGTNATADDITSALFGPVQGKPQSSSSTTTPSSAADESATLSFDESLQALTLLNSLLGGGNNAAATDTATQNQVAGIHLGSSNPALTSLGVDASKGPSNTRQANQLSLNDPFTSTLTNLFLGSGNGQTPNNNNNLQNFKNTGTQMDVASTNQLTGLLGLLNTLGQFGGSSQGSSLFNFGQAPTTQPDYLSTLFNNGPSPSSSSSSTSSQQQPTRASDYLSLLFGGGNQAQARPQIPQSPTISGTNDFLASLLNGGTPKQGGEEMAATNTNLLGLGSLLTGSSAGNPFQNAASPNLLISLLGAQQQRPSLLSSVFALAGNALSGLSGSGQEGRPRVRGMDTRLGLGYRFGPNADAQVMWEIGPQLFTEPLTNEQREALLAQRERQARAQVEAQQQQLAALHGQLKEYQELQTKQELQRLNPSVVANPVHEDKGNTAEASSLQLVRHLRKTNQRENPQTLTDILFGPTAMATAASSPIPNMQIHVPNQNGRFRPRPKQNGVRAFSGRPNAGAIIGNTNKNTKENRMSGNNKANKYSNNEPNSLLTQYEKFLLKQSALLNPLPSDPRPTVFAQRTANTPSLIRRLPQMGPTIPMMPRRQPPQRAERGPARVLPFPHPRPQQQMTMPFSRRSNQFAFNPSTTSITKTLRNGHQIPTRIAQMRMRPALQRRFGEPIPVPSAMAPRRRRVRSTDEHGPIELIFETQKSIPEATPNVNSSPRVSKQRNPSQRNPIPLLPLTSFNPKSSLATQIQRRQGTDFSYQNMVSEAEDSFLKRNAAAYNPTIREFEVEQERLTFQGQNQLNKPKQRPTMLNLGEDGLPTLMHHLRPSANAVYGIINRLANGDNPISKLIHGTTTPSPESIIPPDSLDTFNCYFCNGDYAPTKQPLLIAKPDPTTDTPIGVGLPNVISTVPKVISSVPKVISTVMNTMNTISNSMSKVKLGQGQKQDEIKASGSNIDSEIHIGGDLSDDQLASLFAPNYTDLKIKYQSDKMLNLVPVFTSTTTTPLPPLESNVEFFVDIDNGEVSVRKSIGKLHGFGEDGDDNEGLLATPSKIKTEEELEAEESQKIFEQVQEYLFNSYEEIKFNQALESEMKQHKDKLSSGKDEMSHGMVSKYFNVLRKRTGLPRPNIQKRWLRPPIKRGKGVPRNG